MADRPAIINDPDRLGFGILLSEYFHSVSNEMQCELESRCLILFRRTEINLPPLALNFYIF
jgi:hypothetical protein